MNRAEVKELCYITAIANVPSILEFGLVSHNRAAKLAHQSIAKQGVQDIRAGKIVPGGLRLHDYVNLYFNPRNPMMYYRKDLHQSCCIVRVNSSVLDIAGVIVTDQNAARFAAFRPAAEGLALLDREVVFARYWTHADPIEQDRRKAAQCAEILVPHSIDPGYLTGVYVSGGAAEEALRSVGCDLPAQRDPYLFFL
jgi:hypothetical protein